MAVTSEQERRFILTLDPSGDGDGWGFEVAEVLNGRSRQGREPETVMTVPRPRAPRLRRLVVEAVTASGYPVHSVGPQRRKPFNLAQDPGVRLVLMLRALAPVRIPARRERIAAGVAAMSPEEALYWYALTTNGNAPRGLRALRTLLGE